MKLTERLILLAWLYKNLNIFSIQRCRLVVNEVRGELCGLRFKFQQKQKTLALMDRVTRYLWVGRRQQIPRGIVEVHASCLSTTVIKKNFLYSVGQRWMSILPILCGINGGSIGGGIARYCPKIWNDIFFSMSQMNLISLIHLAWY